MAEEIQERVEVIYLVEGERNPKATRLMLANPSSSSCNGLRAAHGRDELDELLLEDEEEALRLELRLADVLKDEFRLLHLTAKGKIKVLVAYNGREVGREFRPPVPRSAESLSGRSRPMGSP